MFSGRFCLMRWLVCFICVLCMFACTDQQPPSYEKTKDAGIHEAAPDTDLPISLHQPTSADDLAQKIETQCSMEQKNVHNQLKCKARYNILYCELKGGQWVIFQNGCMDACQFVSNQNCTDDTPSGCDCGEGQCWDGIACVAH